METEDFGEKWVRELDHKFSFRYVILLYLWYMGKC